jgi:hypothetical protein
MPELFTAFLIFFSRKTSFSEVEFGEGIKNLRYAKIRDKKNGFS